MPFKKIIRMFLKRNLSKGIFIILFLACLISIASRGICFSYFNSSEEVSANLRKPKTSIEKPAAKSEVSSGKPVVYLIGEDDVLNISVWQNLSQTTDSGDKSKQKEYTINKGDVLEISVWQWPDLLKEVIVRPDGKVTFPLVGDIQAEGITLTELDNLLTKKLTEFIRSPEVSVMIKQFGLAAGTANKGIMSFIKINDLSIDNIKVRPDGKISFPLVGDIQVKGMSLDELRESLASKVAKFVNNVDVFVQVNEFGGNKVVLLGEVSDPGVYKTSGQIRILEVLSLAGGQTKDAILRNVFILRGELSNPKVIKVNLSKAMTGRDFSQNILIEPRDVIYVPKSFISDVNYVLTQLVQPLTTSASASPAIRAVRSRVVTPKK